MKNSETVSEPRKAFAMDEYLSQFDKSPYSYPDNDYWLSSGTTTPKGAWFQDKK